MIDQEVASQATVHQNERAFYTFYDWCLNPIRTVRHLFDSLAAEIDRHGRLPVGWQRAESTIALYLFVCAIACALDDYLSWRPFVFLPLSDDYPQFASLIFFAQGVLNIPYLILSARRLSQASAWKKRWKEYVEWVCSLLIKDENIGSDKLAKLREGFFSMGRTPLPEDFLRRKMKLHEGYRCQDLTHHDIITLAEKFIAAHPSRDAKIVIVGPRTAAAYFAPLLKCHFADRGFKNVVWTTIRPKIGISRAESRFLRQNITRDCLVVLTDDYSNTGKTFRTIVNKVLTYGVPAENITLLAPIHPTQPHVQLSSNSKTKLITLHHEELHKNALLDRSTVEPLLKEYCDPGEGEVSVCESSPELDAINARLAQHYPHSFQVRLKKVYDVEVRTNGQLPSRKRVLAKSVGWGWLGYHAYVAGARLEEWVPRVLGMRNGFLFTEWVSGKEGIAPEVSRHKPEIFASYIGDRASRLRINEDPRFRPPDTGWGWLEIIRILRKAYGPRLGYLKKGALIKRLAPLVGPVPALIDGRMRPEEWVSNKRGMIKLDFEHHNFGAPEFDVVDPVYDLAGAIFEFQLSRKDQERLIQSYVAQTGDTGALDRILMYELLYGSLVSRFAREGIIRNRAGEDLELLNQRQLRAWNFLTTLTARFTSGLIKRRDITEANGTLVSLDLDGVLDCEVLGFPHTTTSGLAALALLERHGFTVIPNTGRSIEQVQKYCRLYGFPAGVAEYGSVLFDSREDRETPLIDPAAADQLEVCREYAAELPGVFLDYGYRYSVRAFRYNAKGTEGLTTAEAFEFLKHFQLDRLTAIVRGADTYFVDSNASKGEALRHARKLLALSHVIAVGDSDEDLPMLRTADAAFAPGNCSDGVRQLAREGCVRVVPQIRQRGLLEIVRLLLGNRLLVRQEEFLERGKENSFQELLYSLLDIAERPRVQRLIALLKPHQL